jgi:predicted Zn-dependent protease
MYLSRSKGAIMLTRDEARALTDWIFNLSRGSEVSVSITCTQGLNTRFANNQITTAGFTTGLSISISVTQNHCTGGTCTTETSGEALERAVRRAEDMAAVTPADPEYVEPLEPQHYPEICAFDGSTAAARSADLVGAIRSTVQNATKKNLKSFGFYDVGTSAAAIANNRGLFGYYHSTSADYSVTARTLDGTGSGWAASQSPRLADVETERVSRTALDRAVRSQNPRRLDPCKYTVILEPSGLLDVLKYICHSMDTRTAEEGRSFLSKRGGGTLVGERILGENVSLRSDPFNPRAPGIPWDVCNQLPTARTTWVEQGVIKAMPMDRYWARQTQRMPLPSPSNIIMEGGTSTLDDLIASTERGLLITHLWYVRLLQQDTLQLTGLTRDGLFYIEKGKIQYPVLNFRFNQSVVEMLKNIDGMTKVEAVGQGRNGVLNLLPTVKIRDFNMASLSDAV